MKTEMGGGENGRRAQKRWIDCVNCVKMQTSEDCTKTEMDGGENVRRAPRERRIDCVSVKERDQTLKDVNE